MMRSDPSPAAVAFLALALAPTAGSALPAAAHAQGLLDLRPSVSVTQAYDSNLFATSIDRRSDFITRVTPALGAEYRMTPLRLFGRVTFDVERFASHGELSRLDARRQASAGLEYRPTPRTTLAADVEAAGTRTPGEFSVETGITLPRARATRTAVRSSAVRRLDPRTEGRVEYAFRDDRVEGGLAVGVHSATVSADRRVSPRTSVRLDYRFEQFRFGSAGAEMSSATSNLLGAGWTRALTADSSLSLGAGPRLTDGTLAAELTAALRWRIAPADVALAFGRTQTTVIGVPGPVDTGHVSGSVSWPAGPALRVRVAPAFFTSRLDGLHADVYRVAVEVVRRLTHTLSLDVSLDSSVQRGHLGVIRADRSIARHAVLIRLAASSSVRPR
jgi:hypothetical protein